MKKRQEILQKIKAYTQGVEPQAEVMLFGGSFAEIALWFLGIQTIGRSTRAEFEKCKEFYLKK